MWYYMDTATTHERMSDEGRALLTETEAAILTGEKDVSDNYRYKVQSLVRNRVRKHFGDDLDTLEENFPEVYEMVVDEACDQSFVADDEELERRFQDLVAARDREQKRADELYEEVQELRQQDASAEGGDVDDQLVANIEEALSAAQRAQESNHVDAATIDDIVAYLERAQEAIGDE